MMADELMDPSCASDGALCTASKNLDPEESSPVTLQSTSLPGELSLPVLAALCLAEIDNYRRGEPYTERYGLELLHRALMNRDQEAWTWVQHCFRGLVYGWVRRHPQRAMACRLESEENYIAQAFERFWQATACQKQLQFKTLAAALQYLRVSLHGAVLDTLRAYQRPREVSLPEPGAVGEPSMEDVTCDSELWDILKGLFSNPREQRLAYLLFYCGLVRGKSCIIARRSGVLCRKSMFYDAPSWCEYYAIWIPCAGGSASSVLPLRDRMALCCALPC